MPDEDDKALFRKAMQGVKPLKGDASLFNRRSPIRHNLENKNTGIPVDLPLVSDNYYVDDESAMFFRRAGIQHKIFARLKKGDMRPQAVLDLHGVTLNTARNQVVEFIIKSYRQSLKSIIIIHGQGFGSRQKRAVLKPKVYVWLRQLKEVLAFCPVQARDGGAGATYILLKSSRNDEQV